MSRLNKVFQDNRFRKPLLLDLIPIYFLKSVLKIEHLFITLEILRGLILYNNSSIQIFKNLYLCHGALFITICVLVRNEFDQILELTVGWVTNGSFNACWTIVIIYVGFSGVRGARSLGFYMRFNRSLFILVHVNSDLQQGRWFSPGTPVSCTNKPDRHYISEIALKVALNTITLSLTDCIVCHSSIYGFCLPLCYLQTFLKCHFS